MNTVVAMTLGTKVFGSRRIIPKRWACVIDVRDKKKNRLNK